MSKENQIDKQAVEEMAKVIKSSLDGLGCGNFNFTGDEISIMFAKALYNANYRKQSEGEWIEMDTIDDGWTRYGCNNCDWNTESYYKEKYDLPRYCPNCGAKMKGGAE